MASESLTLDGPLGALEAMLEMPAAGAAGRRGTVVVSAPNPQQGGTMNNKVVTTLARACRDMGWQVLRFNYRGVGRSAGSHDDGPGETQDLLAVLDQAVPAGEALILAGFSFGSFVTLNALRAQAAGRQPLGLLLVGVAAPRMQRTGVMVPETLRPATLVVHGQDDEVIPLQAALDWARPQVLPVTVLPDTGHFFHGRLTMLKLLAEAHLARWTAPA